MNQTLVEMLARNREHARAFRDRFDDVQDAQHPDAVTVCCADSRVLGDHAWGNDDPGHVFSVGNIGNRVVQATDAGRAVSGDVLYPVEHTGTDTVVVVGHTGCGAVTATYDALTTRDCDAGAADAADSLDEPPGIEHCVALLAPMLEPGVERLPEGLDDAEAVNHLVEYNVDRQVAFLRSSDDVPERVDAVGVVYDFQDAYSGQRGEVHVVNVDGERDPAALRDAHPEVADRVERRWTY